jgi:hypothetical protein
MNKLTLALLLISSPAWGTISLANHATSSSLTCNATCSAFALGFTAAVGDLLVITSYTTTNQHLSSGDTGYGTWHVSANCTSYEATSGAGATSCAYIQLTSTTTSVTMTFSATVPGSAILHARQYHSTISGTWGVETVPAGTVSTSCGTSGSPCTTANITITGANDVLVASIATGDTACSVVSPWGNFFSPTGDGAVDNLNTTTGTGASFIQGNSCPTGALSTAAMISIGFIEPASASSRTMPVIY